MKPPRLILVCLVLEVVALTFGSASAGAVPIATTSPIVHVTEEPSWPVRIHCPRSSEVEQVGGVLICATHRSLLEVGPRLGPVGQADLSRGRVVSSGGR
jgi:hypothetical protein